MERLSIRRLLQLSAATPVVLALLISGNGVVSATTAAGPHLPREATTQRCDGNQVMHEATHRYRMFYDYPYASAQTMAAATKVYRMFYDYPYAAAQRMADATDRYCAGHP